ncbi:MAG: sigma-54-dependent Fis family transcriptional regulator [Elusimicrobia bacterium]|nr:sigma-54-dependent Fis family transcriptional regulator [Elusimicrobiota bacterium]
MKEKILVIDDEPEILENCRRILEFSGYRCQTCPSSPSAMDIFASDRPDLVLTDLRMPGKDGLDLLREIRSLDSKVPIILFTAFATWETAVSAIKDGASDYIAKPISKEQLLTAVEKCFRERRLEEENLRLKQELGLAFGFDKLVGASLPLKKVLETVRKIAPVEANVLIQGESGTGKELVARAIHRNSKRAQSGGRFVPVDCASLPENLLESELFGHEKGAFTDAQNSRPGLFEFADGGTIFLDEIGEMPVSLQAKLLRVLQEKQFRRLGSNRLINSDFRLIAATNRDLKKAVTEKRFREDLYYRLDVISIELPPLRERTGDVELLTLHFLQSFSRSNHLPIRGISRAALEKLKSYPWPGNVRELENVMERAVSLANTDQIQVEDLPENFRSGSEVGDSAYNGSFKEVRTKVLESFYKNYFQRLLAKHRGNISRASEEARIDRKTVHRLLTRYQIRFEKE